MLRQPASMLDSVQPDERDDAASLSELAYTLLRRDILEGRLAGGERLKMQSLRQRYELGATPLREALSRLSSEGLAVLEQQRGFRVAPIGLADLEDLSDMRLMLEVEAMRRAVARGDDHWEGAIVSAFHKLGRLEAQAAQGVVPDPDVWEARNREFHDALVAAAGSPWLLRTRGLLYDLHERYRRLSRARFGAGSRWDVHEEHRAIMQAVIDRDADGAAVLLQEHIGKTVDVIRAHLAEIAEGAEDKK